MWKQLLIYQRLKKLILLWLLIKSIREKQSFFFSFVSTTDFRRKISLILQTLSSSSKTMIFYIAFKLVTTWFSSAMIPSLATITSKTIKPQIVSSFIFLVFKYKPKVKLFTQAIKANFTQLQDLFLSYLRRTFCICYSLKRYFLTFYRLLLFVYIRLAQVVQILFKEASVIPMP